MTRAEQGRSPGLAGVLELRSAEREAAAALGIDWRHYTWARDRTAHAMTEQRQAEDRRLLVRGADADPGGPALPDGPEH